MASTTSATPAGTRPGRTTRQPLTGRHPGTVGMLLGGVLTIVGSLLPWVMTPLGTLPGTGGPGLWTLSAGFIAVAGALLARRWVAFAHALVAGGAVALVAGWQLLRLAQLSAATDAWGQLLPSIGLVMVTGGAVVLLRTAWRLARPGVVATRPST